MEFVSNPKNMAIVLPHVIRNYNISKGKPAPGFTFDWEFALMGIPFKGTWKITKYTSSKLYVAQTEGMIKSTWTYTFAEKNGKTTWNATVEYETPKKLLARFAQSAVKRINEKDLDRFLNNVKVLVEQ